MENKINPWVGLRAYKEGEVLYGRDRDIRELSMFVLAEKEFVIYGKSGTGKSSIINAGILPSAKRNGYVPVYIRLEHKPDSTPYVSQIRNAIEKEGIVIRPLVPSSDSVNSLLWEFFHTNEFFDKEGKKVKLLIVFDQFEEIFTLQDYRKVRENFFNELADLLNDIRPDELSLGVDEGVFADIGSGSEDISNDDIFAQIDDMDVDLEYGSTTYLTDVDVHFVFTLREDYLSEFEYYTRKIPSLKQNRYAFRPIDVKQAMEIIVNPRKGLVSEEVAKKIISKITKIDFKDLPSDTGMDSAILSLFLSELFKRLPDNAETITGEMVDKFGNDIIKDFYIGAVSDTSRIRPSSVEWIEEILLTKDNNHRDNKAIGDVLDKQGGLTPEELHYLEDEKRILTRFTRSNSTRIEFVHDVIGDVAAQHKNMRETERQTRVEQDLLAKKVRRKLWITILVAAMLTIGLVSAMWFYMSKPLTGLPHKQSFIISFVEDSLTNENEYWKGDLSVIGHRLDAPDTVLLQRTVDKGQRDSVFMLEIDTLRSVSFSMKFPSYSKYNDISMQKDYADIMKMLNVQIQLQKKRPKTYSYFGHVSVEVNGVKWPVQNALICLHDITTRTDSCGNFKYHIEKEITEVDDIYIIKKGFNNNNDFKTGKIDPNEVHEFSLVPKDSIKTVKTWVDSIDSLSSRKDKFTYTIKNQKVFKMDGTTDIFNLVAVINRTVNRKNELIGYFYFNSDLKKNHVEDKYYSYYKLTGDIDKDWIDGFKNYSVEGINYIGNVIDVTGTYKQKVGSWTGEISSPVGFNAHFPEN